MHELFIYNIYSGKGISKARLNKIIRHIRSIYPDIVLCPTKQRGDAYTYTTTYINTTKLIFVLGGDGTIHETVSAMINANKDIPICLIPNGTMNDLAKSLNLPKNYKDAIALASTTLPYPINVLQVNNTYSVYACAIGRFAHTSYSTKQLSKKALGKLAYFFTALSDLFYYKPIRAKITVDGKTFTDVFALIVIVLGKYIAGFKILRDTPSHTNATLVTINENPTKRNCSLTSAINISKFFVKGIHDQQQYSHINLHPFHSLIIELDNEYPIVVDGEKIVSKTFHIITINNKVKIFSPLSKK